MTAPILETPPLTPAHSQQPVAPAATVQPRSAGAIEGLEHLPEAVRERLGALAQRSAAPAAPQPSPLQPPNLERLAGRGELGAALAKSKAAIKAVGWISCAINVLMLAGPLFMLQVYDRVIPSNSLATLGVLTLLTALVYGLIGMLEHYRSRIIIRTGVEIDQRIGNRIFEASLKNSVSGTGVSVQALRELDALRNFVSGPAPMTFFDIWWTPIYLLVIFATHWLLGLASLVGAGILLILAWVSEAQSRAPMTEAGKASARSIELDFAVPEQVQGSNQGFDATKKDSNSTTIAYDASTIVEYQGKRYGTVNLERGDVVNIDVSQAGSGFLAKRIAVQ